jgi:hypothetical protein
MSINNQNFILQNIQTPLNGPISPTDGALGGGGIGGLNPIPTALYTLPIVSESDGMLQISNWFEFNSRAGCVFEILNEGYTGFVSIEVSNDQDTVYNFYSDTFFVQPSQLIYIPGVWRWMRAKAQPGSGQGGELELQARVYGQEVAKQFAGLTPGPILIPGSTSSMAPQAILNVALTQQYLALNVSQLGALNELVDKLYELVEVEIAR